MLRTFILFGLAATLMLGACEQGQQDQVGQQSGQEPAREQPSGEQEQRAMTREQQQTEPQQGAGQEKTAQQALEQQEFYGKSPAFGNAPESIILEAKNGNVTFSHKAHADMMDCQQCHEGTPGKIDGFGKDQAHELCIGCHKEKGAGPAKCQECHKK